MSIELYNMTTEYKKNGTMIKTIHNEEILNTSNDFDYYEELCDYATVYRNQYGELGYLDITIDNLKEFYEEHNENMDEELKDNLKKLIQDTEKNNEGFVQLYAL